MSTSLDGSVLENDQDQDQEHIPTVDQNLHLWEFREKLAVKREKRGEARRIVDSIRAIHPLSLLGIHSTLTE